MIGLEGRRGQDCVEKERIQTRRFALVWNVGLAVRPLCGAAELWFLDLSALPECAHSLGFLGHKRAYTAAPQTVWALSGSSVRWVRKGEGSVWTRLVAVRFTPAHCCLLVDIPFPCTVLQVRFFSDGRRGLVERVCLRELFVLEQHGACRICTLHRFRGLAIHKEVRRRS